MKTPPVPTQSDPKIDALRSLKLAGNKTSHQAVEHRRGLIARALRGNKSSLPQLPTPKDSD